MSSPEWSVLSRDAKQWNRHQCRVGDLVMAEGRGWEPTRAGAGVEADTTVLEGLLFGSGLNLPNMSLETAQMHHSLV